MVHDSRLVSEHVGIDGLNTVKTHMRSPGWIFLCVGIGFFLFQLALHISNGVFAGEFGGHPDEAAHFVTGLMVRDFIEVSFQASPMEFAENYYLHYPKVAFGHWPPFFYMVQAGWTLVFPSTHVSLMLLLALLSTMLALTLFSIIRQEFNAITGFFAGLLLMAFPVVQKLSGMVMTEMLLALLSLVAVIFFWRFAEDQKIGDVVGFGIFSTLAILTKGDGLALGLVPLLGLFLSRRLHLLLRPRLWLAVIIVVVFCAPFYWLTLDMVTGAWKVQTLSLEFFLSGIQFYSWHLVSIPGPFVSILIALGIWGKVMQPWLNHDVQPKWAVMAGLVASVWIFHCIVPSSLEERNLIVAVPALLLFFLAGCTWLVDQNIFGRLFGGIRRDVQVTAITFVIAALFIGEAFATPKPIFSGFREVATVLLADPHFKKSVLLISSDPRGEGAFISEVASREDRPGHIILRASKVLGNSGWLNQEYTALHQSDAEVLEYLETIPVGLVIIDESLPVSEQDEHHRRLTRILKAQPPNWVMLGTYPLKRGTTTYPQALRVYLQKGHQERPVGMIRLNMESMLKRTIESSGAH